MENENKIPAGSRIAVGCDHTALDLKRRLIEHLETRGFIPTDCGSYETDASDDYPDIAAAVCEKVTSGQCRAAVLICGTGIGMAMTANKFGGIRAVQCADCYSVRYSRLHNDANVICFGARVMGSELAAELLDIFLETPFEGGRHQRRVDKINALGRI